AGLAPDWDVDVARAEPADLERLARVRDRLVVHVLPTSIIDLLARPLDRTDDRNDPTATRHPAAYEPHRAEIERRPGSWSQQVPYREIAREARAHLEQWKLEVFPAGRQLEELYSEIEVLLVDRKLEMPRIQPADIHRFPERNAHS